MTTKFGNFEVTNIAQRWSNDGTVEKSVVYLRQEQPYFAQIDYLLDGDVRGMSNDAILEKVAKAFFNDNFVELAHKELVNEVDKQKEAVEFTQKEVDRTNTIVELMVLNAVMSKNIMYGTIYKGMVELLPKAEPGKEYKANQLVTIEDPALVEKNGEGKLVVIQLNKDFTYNGESVADFKENGSKELDGTGVAWPFEGKE